MKLFLINLTQAVRNLVKFKWQTLISVVGLVFGLVCLAFSANWFWYETHYESFRKDCDRLYLLKCRYAGAATGDVSDGLSYLLTDEFGKLVPSADALLLIRNETGSFPMEINGVDVQVGGGLSVTPDYFRYMDQPLLYGDSRTALKGEHDVVISRSLAQRVFGKLDVVGQPLDFNGETHTVAGVVEDVPAHSHLRADLYAPLEPGIQDYERGWNVSNFQGIVVTSRPEQTQRELAKMMAPADTTYNDARSYLMVPLAEGFQLREPATYWIDFLYPVAFTAVSALLVLSALFNYIFVLTTQMAGRLREYKLRISLGGTFGTNAAWLLTEVGVLQIVVIALSAAALEVVSHFSGMADVCATIYRVWGLCLVPYFVLVALGLVYPLWNLRRLYKAQFAGKAVRPQRPGPMLVVQLTVCVLLLFVFWGAGRQFRLMLNADLGFTTENILRVGNSYGALHDVFFDVPKAICSEGTACIDDAVAVNADLFERWGSIMTDAKNLGLDKDIVGDSTVALMDVFPSTFRFFDVKPLSGNLPDGRDEGVVQLVFSKAALDHLHLRDYPTGPLRLMGKDAKAVGVVDLRSRSFRSDREALVYYVQPEGELPKVNALRTAVYVKYKPGMRKEAEQVVSRVLEKFNVPENYVEVTSLDEHIRETYGTELRYYRLFTMLMVGAVLIALFGVISMSMYTMRMHRRSIAIRRVYGADFRSLARHYLGGYVGVSLLAAVIAYPVGLYAMTEWLKAYTERVEVGWLQGVAVLAVVVLIVVTVVLWQVRRVMGDNPADVVRSDS